MVGSKLLVREVDLLKYMLDADGDQSKDETVKAIMQDAPPTLTANTNLKDAIQEIVQHNVVIVSDGGELVGILSKIDALDFIQR